MSDTPAQVRPRPLVSRTLFALLLLACLVRLGYWMEARALPLFQSPTGDAATYLRLAEELERDGLGAPAELERVTTSRHFGRIGRVVRRLGLTSVALEVPAMETPKSGSYAILRETLAGFRDSFREGDEPLHCEIQILARTESESEGWRKVIRGLPR